MKTSTRSFVTHKTAISAEIKNGDGGRALLMELFDDLRSDRRIGTLTAKFSVGGAISSLIFEETELIPQRDITVDPTIH